LWVAAFGSALATPSLVFGQAGVVVDARGVLRAKTAADSDGQLTRQRIAAARASLSPKVAASSKLRYISLRRLEEAVRAHQGAATEEMRNLAGLLRIHYVFLYPDSKDIVIAGPAEGWVNDGFGRPVGLNSGRPVVRLEDLVEALRAFPPGGQPTRLIGCSIDPTKEGLAAMQQFLLRIGSTATPNDTQFIVNGLQSSLGLQTVSVNGVSPKTHFAMVLVEADYRMKLIGIGLEKPPVRLISYVDRARPSAVRRNALQRWYFVPDYECVRTGDEGAAMELVGDGVKLVGQSELVASSGQRQAAARTDPASQAFVTAFTQKYAALAEKSPVYAELRNLIDLAVAAAYIQHEDFYAKAGWKMDFFGDEAAFTVETYDMPKQVASAINAIWRGTTLMTPIAGGVHIEPTQALASGNRLPDEDGKVSKAHQQVKIQLAKGQWWWD
jgi:hypothetical protein